MQKGEGLRGQDVGPVWGLGLTNAFTRVLQSFHGLLRCCVVFIGFPLCFLVGLMFFDKGLTNFKKAWGYILVL